MNKRLNVSLLLPLLIAPCAKASVADTILVHGIDEVVVTGSNHATSPALLPYTVSVVNSR